MSLHQRNNPIDILHIKHIVHPATLMVNLMSSDEYRELVELYGERNAEFIVYGMRSLERLGIISPRDSLDNPIDLASGQ